MNSLNNERNMEEKMKNKTQKSKWFIYIALIGIILFSGVITGCGKKKDFHFNDNAHDVPVLWERQPNQEAIDKDIEKKRLEAITESRSKIMCIKDYLVPSQIDISDTFVFLCDYESTQKSYSFYQQQEDGGYITVRLNQDDIRIFDDVETLNDSYMIGVYVEFNYATHSPSYYEIHIPKGFSEAVPNQPFLYEKRLTK